MENKQTFTDVVRSLQGAQVAAREFTLIASTWYSNEEADRNLCRDIIESVPIKGGLYEQYLRSISDPAAKLLFENLVKAGTALDSKVLGVEKTYVPGDIASYVGDVMSHVRSKDARVGELQSRLEAAEAEVTRLKPYEGRWNEITGELSRAPVVGLEKLMQEYKAKPANE